MSTAYASQGDLEIALGGADVLVQLADPHGTGVADAAIVTDYLDSGGATIRSAVEVKHEPETIDNLDADSRRHLRDLNKWWSASVAWLEGSRGQAMPDRVREQREWVQVELDRIRTGERRLGRVSGGKVAALAQRVGVVDHDPISSSSLPPEGTAPGVSVAALRASGFR